MLTAPEAPGTSRPVQDDHPIETRKERGEAYSTIAGFFKQYELHYVVGDERDLIRLRTNYRQPPEDVYAGADFSRRLRERLPGMDGRPGGAKQ